MPDILRFTEKPLKSSQVVDLMLGILKPKYQIRFYPFLSDFMPHWLSFIDKLKEQARNREIQVLVKAFSKLYEPLPVAYVPSPADYHVYVENYKSIEDLFFAVNTAYASMRDTYYPLVIPFVRKETAKQLLKTGVNPVIIEHALFHAPYIASISTTNLLDSYDHARYAVSIAMKRYLETEDRGLYIMGYMLVLNTKNKWSTLKESLSNTLRLSYVLLEDLCSLKPTTERYSFLYAGVDVDALVVYL